MSNYLLIAVLFVLNACSTPQTLFTDNESVNIPALTNFELAVQHAKNIKQQDLEKSVFTLSADSMQGRFTGTSGGNKAAQFLKSFYKEMAIDSPSNKDYFQTIPKSFFDNKATDSASNVMAYLKGTTYPEEVIILSAHYDHLGVDDNGGVYNGADDNASGTAAILNIAKAFKKASDEGYSPKRSLLFLHVTGEEIGLYGSRYYVENPVFSLVNTVADLNIDMIGRVDEFHRENPNYLYIIGSDRLSKELHAINERVNQKYLRLELDYKFNAKNEPNKFYYRSDHYNFAKNNIPVIFYFNGTHDDYHQVGDTPEKINLELLQKRTQHIFLTAWELANRNNRIKLD